LAVFDAHADAMGMGFADASCVVLQRSDNLLAFFLDAAVQEPKHCIERHKSSQNAMESPGYFEYYGH